MWNNCKTECRKKAHDKKQEIKSTEALSKDTGEKGDNLHRQQSSNFKAYFEDIIEKISSDNKKKKLQRIKGEFW